MLNPSTADETQEDPTIRRCLGFAKSWGFDRLIIVNIFAFRSTNPDALYSQVDPIGVGNDLVHVADEEARHLGRGEAPRPDGAD